MWSALITGAGQFSLGYHVGCRLAGAHPAAYVLGLDRRGTKATVPDNMKLLPYDLNPLDDGGGFDKWSTRLGDLLEREVSPKQRNPVKYLMLGASSYFSAPMQGHPLNVRKSLLGTNVVGKFELVYQVLVRNDRYGVNSATEVTVLDMGSLHSLLHTSHRGFYNPTKSASLGLCAVLDAGGEVARSLHVAPGPIDTPMLHWNHWVLKEGGDEGLWQYVLESRSDLYEVIFGNGDRVALKEAVHSYRRPVISDWATTFDRYLHRRRILLESEVGILTADVLAGRICDMLTEAAANPSGVYVITCPKGHIKEHYYEFGERAR